MSGGHFNYAQYRIRDIIREMEHALSKAEFHGINDAIRFRFLEGIAALKVAEVHAQRADWFLSGDDGPETYLSRLNAELLDLEIKDF